jgi:hypothetical protein
VFGYRLTLAPKRVLELRVLVVEPAMNMDKQFDELVSVFQIDFDRKIYYLNSFTI